MAAWNPNGQAMTQMVRIPVTGASWTVEDASGTAVPSQATALDNRTLQLPLLYINYFGLNNATRAQAVTAHTNQATHTPTFAITPPALGYATYTLKKAAAPAAHPLATTSTLGVAQRDQPTTVENEFYKLSLDYSTNRVTKVTNLKSGVSTSLDLDWGYYVSSEGGSTWWMNGTKLTEFKSPQASGAYLFRTCYIGFPHFLP